MTNKQLKEMMRDISPRYQQKADARAASAEHTKRRSWMPALVSGAAVCCAGLAAVIFLPKLHHDSMTANESALPEIQEITDSMEASDLDYGAIFEFDDLRNAFMRIMTPAYAPCAYTPTEEEQTAISTAFADAECVRADDSAEIPDGERITVYVYDENEPERLVLTVFPNDLVRVSADGYADHGAVYQFPQEAVEAIRRAAQHDGDDLVNRLTWCREDTIGTPEFWMNFVINPKEYDMSTQEGIFSKMRNSFDYFNRLSGTVYVSNYYFEGTEPHCELLVSDFQTNLNLGTFYEDTKLYTGSDMETLRELNLGKLQFDRGTTYAVQDDICYDILDSSSYEISRYTNHRIDFPGPVEQTSDHETNVEDIDKWQYRGEPSFGCAKNSLHSEERILGYLNNFKNWEITGKDQINGRVCTEITGKLTGTYGKNLHVQDFVFYVDEETGILMRYFGYDENGNLTDFVIAENMQFEDDAAPVKQIDLTGMTCTNEEAFQEYNPEDYPDGTTINPNDPASGGTTAKVQTKSNTTQTTAKTTDRTNCKTTPRTATTKAAATTNDGMTYEERQQAKYTEILKAAITDKPYDEVLHEEIADLYYFGYRWDPNMSNIQTVLSWNERHPIELLRKIDDHRMYGIQKMQQGGLLYTFYDNSAMTHTAWMSKALSYSDFDDIHIGDTSQKVAALEPVTEHWAFRAMATDSLHPVKDGFTQELLLKDGFLEIHYNMEEKPNYAVGDWIITDTKFYPDFKVEYDFGMDQPFVFDYSILPEDYPK